MKRNKSRIHRWLVWLLIGTIIETTAYPLHGQPSTSERRDLKISPKKSEGAAFLQDALRLYNEEMEWDSAIVKFKEALAAGLDADDRAKAYWYLALIAYAKDNFQEAEDYMYETLRAKASFTLPESVRGSKIEEIFKAALARTRTDQMPPEVEVRRQFGKLYLIIGTVVAIGGGIMAWLLWPGETWPQSEPPFPPPLSE